jgi:hypothetical protein
MGSFFEDISTQLAERQARSARDARERFARTSAPIWAAMRTPDWSGNVSTPDYDEDFTSAGENARSVRGPDFWEEKQAAENDMQASRARAIMGTCIDRYRRLAENSCELDPEGTRTLPTGARLGALSQPDCLSMWADGIPDRSTTEQSGAEATRTSGWEVHGGLSGETTVGKSGGGKIGGAIGGSYNRSSSRTESHGTSESLSFPGARGYNVACGQKGMQWFDEQVDAALGHYAE